MSRASLLLLLGACAGARPVETPVPPVDEVEIRVDHVGIGEPCTTVTCATPSVSLSLRSGTKPSTVRLLRVSITGPQGRSLDLPAQKPAVFTSAGIYAPWNERIGADEVMAIHYDLARVDWDHFDDALSVHPVSLVIEVDGRVRVFGVPTREERAIVDDFTEG